MSEINIKNITKLPRHIAIIMDGNGRWAKQQGKERVFGHQKGVDTVRKIVETSVEAGIEYLSLFAFSVENWKRPKEEVDALMELLVLAIEREIEDLNKNNVRLITIGDTSKLPQYCLHSIEKSTKKTSQNTGLTLNIALSYSGRWDIIEAARKICIDVINKKLNPEDISEQLFSTQLSTANIPEPELLIRTSGEYRISNFFLWQLAYTEIYYSNKLWPEFSQEDFLQALLEFSTRERRFGCISEQLNNDNI